VKIDAWEMICWLPFFGGQKGRLLLLVSGSGFGMQGTS